MDPEGASQDAAVRKPARGPFLVVGLGNPGIEYQWTPHNAGFLAVDRLAERTGAVVSNRRCRALTATTRIAGREVVLAKPETFMNLSGLSVRALVEEFDAGREDLLVIYDELALPLGTLRVRAGGSSGGHNGARSINGALGSEEWARIRIGVGPDGLETASRRGKDYLLTPMRKKELAVLDEVLDRVAEAVETVIVSGVAAAMNKWNGPAGNDSSKAE
ncbi:MAG TPA: aminoacyl-tRNA hydrolase [Acidobacteriaceae bacterium]|nr:aminoacyl-tRNA hydrolase [Acidobacteriaceae bacterium]